MKRIPLVRRKSIIEAGGIPNSQMVDLAQKNQYFKKRAGDKSIFQPNDVFLVFVASELWEYFPWRYVDEVINEIVKNYRNLWRLLEKNPKQFLVVENREIEVNPDIELGEFIVYTVLMESLKMLDWANKKSLILINLEKIHKKVRDLFDQEGICIGDW